jgi:FecR protein
MRIAPLKIPAFLLVSAVALASPARVTRVGELEGKVEVQLHPGDAWRPALRNLPLVQQSWVRTAPAARVELELDEGSALRLDGNSLFELSDYTRLSTGQRVTILSLDHGVAYFTGEPDRQDALILAVPGAQATVRSGSRVRLEARDDASHIAVLEGVVRFSSPSAELELHEGQTVRVEAGAQSRFFLDREVTPLDSDKWNDARDKVLAATGSGKHVPGLEYGLADLDASGSWIGTSDSNLVWKPKVASGWTPYRDGAWLWYDELGYTWVANEPWGWLPFHYGRWADQSGLGWVWSPGKGAVFKPGEVYWLREANLVGWGPLAPGEIWDARQTPRQYLRSSTTLARWNPDVRELVPADAAEKLKTTQAVFVVAPPSPAFDAARLDVERPVLRAGTTRIVPLIPGVTYALAEMAEASQPMLQPAVPPVPPQPAIPNDVTISPAQGAPGAEVYVPVPVLQPVEVYYPVPVYSGIVVVNPPDDRGHRRTPRPEPPRTPPRLANPPRSAEQVSSPPVQPTVPVPGATPPRAQPPQPVPPVTGAPYSPPQRVTPPPYVTPRAPRPVDPPRVTPTPPPQAGAPAPRATPDPPRASPTPARAPDPPRSNDSGASKSGGSSASQADNTAAKAK